MIELECFDGPLEGDLHAVFAPKPGQYISIPRYRDGGGNYVYVVELGPDDQLRLEYDRAEGVTGVDHNVTQGEDYEEDYDGDDAA